MKAKRYIYLSGYLAMCLLMSYAVAQEGGQEGWWMKEPIRWVQTNLRQTDAGLDARRLALLARRLQRADSALEKAVDEAAGKLSAASWTESGAIVLDARAFLELPDELGLRLLGRAIMHRGHA